MISEDLIKKSIATKKIQLTNLEKLIYFRISIYILTISILLYFLELNLYSIFFLLIVSFISYFIKKQSLKLKSIKKISAHNLFEKIDELVINNQWIYEYKSKNLVILKTEYLFSPHRYFFTKSIGEKIYVFKNHDEILYRSIYIYSNYEFIIPNGENNRNEEIIKKAIC